MDWPDDLFRWFAAAPARYWITAWGAFGLSALLAFAPETAGSARAWARRLAHPAWFAAAVLVTFLAFRWPTWFAPDQINPDEAHMIAGAITLRDFPVFWRDVDGTTHGPLNDYVLLLAPALGLPLDFAGARFVGTLLQTLTLLAVWVAGRRLFDPVSARLGVLPALLMWAATSFWDFLQYSSELMPIALAAAGGALGTVGLTAQGVGSRRAALVTGAVLLGLVPYAKLQGVPLAGVIGGLLVVGAWRSSAGRARWLELTCLLAGALAPTLLLLGGLALLGLLGEFHQAYWRSNLIYAGERHMTYAKQLKEWTFFLDGAKGSLAFFQGTLWAALLLLVPAAWGPRRLMLGLGWLLALAAFYTVLAPGRHYFHYAHFLFAPGAFLLAASLHAARAGLNPWSHWLARGATVFAMLVALSPQVSFRRAEPHPFLEGYAGPVATGHSEIGRLLRAAQQPGDRLAIWGWRPQLYVETGLPQATRDGQTSRMIDAGPMFDFYRARYLADFVRTRPRWFVDAVGGNNFAYTDRWAQGHQTFRDLAAVIRSDYVLVGEADGCRLYRRKSDS
jgi:hypothetical protein